MGRVLAQLRRTWPDSPRGHLDPLPTPQQVLAGGPDSWYLESRWSLAPLTDELDRQWALCSLNMSLFQNERGKKVPPTKQMVQKWNRTKRHGFQLTAWRGEQDSTLPAPPTRTTATTTRAASTHPALTKC